MRKGTLLQGPSGHLRRERWRALADKTRRTALAYFLAATRSHAAGLPVRAQRELQCAVHSLSSARYAADQAEARHGR